jgi:wobble nucleotide-excising tRNase
MCSDSSFKFGVDFFQKVFKNGYMRTQFSYQFSQDDRTKSDPLI